MVVNDTANDLGLTGAASMVNDGTIVSKGAGLVLIDCPLVNAGTLSVQAGTMQAITSVSGDGVATIGGGTLDLGSALDQAVTFTGGGALDLAQSRKFTQTVTGFSTKGRTTLDLEDIRFVDAGEATYSGAASGGVLTVTDGTHTAHITLKGDYRGVTFVASKAVGGGTDVVAQRPMRSPRRSTPSSPRWPASDRRAARPFTRTCPDWVGTICWRRAGRRSPRS